jgi:hypothetical protein
MIKEQEQVKIGHSADGQPIFKPSAVLEKNKNSISDATRK